MDFKDIKNKYPFLSDLDCYNLYIISKCKIRYKEIKKLKKKDLIYYTKNYILCQQKNSALQLKCGENFIKLERTYYMFSFCLRHSL